MGTRDTREGQGGMGFGAPFVDVQIDCRRRVGATKGIVVSFSTETTKTAPPECLIVPAPEFASHVSTR